MITLKLIVTVVGKDRVGIIAAVTKILADNNVNILSINQNILDGFFNMILFSSTSNRNSANKARLSASKLKRNTKIFSTSCTRYERLSQPHERTNSQSV